MGAMLRFKQETGREITDINPSSLSDLCTYLWCCVASASRREGKQFNLSLMEFADALDPEALNEWGASIMEQRNEAAPSSVEGGAGEAEKKSR